MQAFNDADADRVSAFCSEDAINHQVSNEPVQGKAKTYAMFQHDFSAADMVCVVESILQEGEWAILEWRDPLGLRGYGFLHVVNGLIVLQRGYWDKLSFLRAHNLPVPD